MFNIVIMVVVLYLYTFTKIHLILYLKLVHFIVCRLYLGKADLKSKLKQKNLTDTEKGKDKRIGEGGSCGHQGV